VYWTHILVFHFVAQLATLNKMRVDFSLSKPLALSLAVVACTYIVVFMVKLFLVRSRMLALRRQGLVRLTRSYKEGDTI